MDYKKVKPQSLIRTKIEITERTIYLTQKDKRRVSQKPRDQKRAP